MGKKGRNDIKEIVEDVLEWDDYTPLGLDTLRRQLDDFYSESSQARSFVASLTKKINQTIKKAVPEYAEMTEGYKRATNLIKEVQTGLMLRKHGMTGRVTADMTLRRLTSAMREGFEMRKELVQLLGRKAGADIEGDIAGLAMSEFLPRGLIGKFAAGSATYASTINPLFLSVLGASSPRAVGEFLNVYGKALREVQKKAPAVYKTLAFGAGKETGRRTEDAESIRENER